MEHFYIEKKLTPFKDCPAITFTHNLSYDNARKHSLHLNGGHIELYIYISGEVDFIVDDTYYPLEKGDILIINPNQVHVAVPKKPTEYERFYILLPTHSFEKLKHDPVLSFLNRPKTAPAKISMGTKQKQTALLLLKRVDEILKGEYSSAKELQAISLILELLCLIEENSDNKTLTDTDSVYVPETIKNVLRYIGENAANITSAGDIAEHFHLSLPYLSSLFKKYVRVTLSAYLRTKKIAVAKQLLENGYSVSYACYESGFSDSSYFIKIFKEQMGVTPHKYKANRINR